MNSYVNQAQSKLEEGHAKWGLPLIVGLEDQYRHSAIKWVISLVEECVKDSIFPDRFQAWLDWLNELQTVVEQLTFSDLEYLTNRGQLIFNDYPHGGRTPHTVMISHLYASETMFRNDSYDGYLSMLSLILRLVYEEFNQKEGVVNGFQAIADRYPLSAS